MGMLLKRFDYYNEYIADKIQHNGFVIENEDKFSSVDIDSLVNSPKYMDSEFRCECGAFIGQDLIGQTCPVCNSEIILRGLNFGYTGWLNLGEHCVISPAYYDMLKRVVGTNMLRFILGDYIEDRVINYTGEPTIENDRREKKPGRKSEDKLEVIKNKIPKSKHCYQGLGHDVFRDRFEEILQTCASRNNPEMDILIENKLAVFTNKIPIYSTAFRPMNRTSETCFYPKITKPFTSMTSIVQRLPNMVLPEEKIAALNYIQKYFLEACAFEVETNISHKGGIIRSQINGGTFSHSGRAVISLDISLNADEVDIPLSMLVTVYQYKLAHMVVKRQIKGINRLEHAYLFVNNYEENEEVLHLLDEILAQNAWIFLLREPTNNLASIGLCRIRNYKIHDDTISLPPEPLGGYNADFDGDALDACFLPAELSDKFEAFHLSCMTDYVNEQINISLKEWCDICLGIMSE
jgi:hypothetical protein